MIDVSVFGSGKRGLLLSVEGIYYRKSSSVAEYIAYKDIAKDKDIVARKLGDVCNAAHSVTETVETVMNVLEGWMSK